MVRRRCALFIVMVALLVPAVGQAQERRMDFEAIGLDPTYRVGAGDVLRVDVYGEEDLSGSFVIGSSGELRYPLVGQLQIEGMTADEVAERLRTVLSERYLVAPHVTVRIDAYGSKPVQVLGAVENPGVYYLLGETTLLEMLARAGDVDDETSAKEVHVMRAGEEPVIVRIDALLQKGEGNVSLQPGDTVYVPEGLEVYVSGEVEKPGAVVYEDGITVTQALTKAGGPKATAQLKQCWILRDGQRVPVNVRAILRGRIEDVPLEPGDQLVIQESVF